MNREEIEEAFRAVGLATEEDRDAMRFENLAQSEGYDVQVIVRTNTSFGHEATEDSPACQA